MSASLGEFDDLLGLPHVLGDVHIVHAVFQGGAGEARRLASRQAVEQQVPFPKYRFTGGIETLGGQDEGFNGP